MLDTYKNIKKLRKQNGWTQEELATRMGYNDRSMIAKIENGKVNLGQSKILEFAKVFGVNAGDLMGNDGIVFPPDTPEAQRIRKYWENPPEEQSNKEEFIALYENVPTDVQQAVVTLLKSYQPKP